VMELQELMREQRDLQDRQVSEQNQQHQNELKRLERKYQQRIDALQSENENRVRNLERLTDQLQQYQVKLQLEMQDELRVRQQRLEALEMEIVKRDEELRKRQELGEKLSREQKEILEEWNHEVMWLRNEIEFLNERRRVEWNVNDQSIQTESRNGLESVRLEGFHVFPVQPPLESVSLPGVSIPSVDQGVNEREIFVIDQQITTLYPGQQGPFTSEGFIETQEYFKRRDEERKRRLEDSDRADTKRTARQEAVIESAPFSVGPELVIPYPDPPGTLHEIEMDEAKDEREERNRVYDALRRGRKFLKRMGYLSNALLNQEPYLSDYRTLSVALEDVKRRGVHSKYWGPLQKINRRIIATKLV